MYDIYIYIYEDLPTSIADFMVANWVYVGTDICD